MSKKRNINLFLIVAIVISLLSLSTIGTAEAVAKGGPFRLILGTSTAGGTYFVLGGGWAKVMGEKLEDVEITVQEGGGPATNIQLIQAGKMDLGLVTVNVAYEGWHGLNWAKGVKHQNIRTLLPMYASYLHVYTLDDSISSIYDLEGKIVSTGTPGNTSEIAGKAILKALGITPKRIRMLSASGQVDSLKDGVVDACFTVTGLPGPFMLDLQTTHKPHLISLSDEDVEKIRKEYPYFFKGIIPKNTYTHQKENITTIAFWNTLVATQDLGDELVYKLVKATFENKDELAIIDSNMKQLSPENVQYSIIPLHPGAFKYYEENNIEVHDSLLPPIDN